MGLTTLFRVFALMLLGVALLMIIPAIIALTEPDDQAGYYVFALIVTLTAAVLCYVASTARRSSVDFRGVLALVLVWWTIIPAFAALPFILGGMSFSDAYFETVAAVTTTGGWLSHEEAVASVSGAVWRALLQWIGGLVSISVAAAIFIRPAFIGIDTLLPPFAHGEHASYVRSLKNAFIAFFPVYFILTIGAFAVFSLSGLPFFNASIAALSLTASGGFIPSADGASITNVGAAPFILPFLILGAINFSLLVWLFRPNKISWRDRETMTFLAIVLILGLIYWALSGFGAGGDLFQQVFNAASFASTNGVYIGEKPPIIFVLVTTIIGGAAVSTAGGFKILRWIVIMRRAREEIRRLVAPSGVFGKRQVANEFGVWMHFLVFTMTLAGLVLIISVNGYDFELAVTAATAALSNAGPLVYLASENVDGFNTFNEPVRWFLVLGMILGRLEAVVALALFNVAFWRA